MQTDEIWKVLELEKTKDEEKVKLAYREKLVSVNPEDDPEGFMRLRQAYEEALEFTKSVEEEQATDAYDLWIKEITEIYHDFEKRVDEREWDRVFDNTLCTSLDTKDIACERLLVFFMSSYYVPHFVWKKVEKLFHITESRQELLEKFPPNFTNFIINEIQCEKDDAYYTYFYGDLKENPDELITALSECFDELFGQLVNTRPDQRNFTALKEKLASVRKMKCSHLYSLVIEEMVAFYEGEMEKAKEYFEDLKSQLGERAESIDSESAGRTESTDSESAGRTESTDSESAGRTESTDSESAGKAESIGDNDSRHSDVILEGYALGYEITGEWDRAEKVRQSLEENTRNLYILSDCIRYRLAGKSFQKAKELGIDCLDRYGNYPVFVSYMMQANEELISEFKEKADGGDIDSAFELGWIYFQNDRLTECIEYIEPLRPEQGSKNEYTYYNLLGRCCLKAAQYDKAIEYLCPAAELIEAVKRKGAEGNDEERMLKRYGLILASVAMAYHEKAVALFENSEMNRKDYEKTEEFLNIAQKYIERSLEEEEEFSNKLYFYREAAEICMDKAQYEKCVDICDILIDQAPEWYYPYMLRQRAFYELDYPRDVIEDYDNLCRLLGDHLENPLLYIYPLMTYVDYNRDEEVKEILKAAKENGAKSPAIDFLAMCHAGHQESDACDLNEIKSCLHEIETGENEFTKAQIADFYFYATMLSEEEAYKQEMIGKGTAVYPGYTKRGYRILASYYERNRDYPKTIDYLNKVLALTSDEESSAFCRLRIGRNYWYMDEDEQAFAIFSEEYEKNPKQPVVNQYLADYYLFQFRNDEKQESIDLALKYINRQMEICTNNEILRIRAEIFLERFEPENAKKDVLAILDDEPENVSAKRLLERILRYEGDFEGAYKVCKELLEVESDNRYTQKYGKFVNSCMALRKYEEIESCIKNGYHYDREWALERLIKLYVCMDRTDDLLALGEASVREGKSEYEQFLGYRTILDALAAKGEVGKIDPAVEEYIDFITTHEDRKLYGYDCLSIFYFENYGNLRKAILYTELMKGFDLPEYYARKARLSLATYYGLDGNMTDAKKNFEEFVETLNKQGLTIESWLKEDGYSRASIYDLGLYYYAVGDGGELEKWLKKMKTRVICKNCDKCRCFEMYILQGHLELLRGNKAAAKEAYKEALDCGEKINSMYVSRLLREV